MKWVLVAAIALAIGFVAGGYAPRSELEKVQKELAEARAQVERGERDRTTWMAGLNGLLAQRAAAPPAPTASTPTRPQAPPTPSAPPSEDPDEEGDGPNDGGADDGGRQGDFNLKDPQSFEKLRSAAELRSGQYRAAFVEAARLDARKQEALDEIIRGMNAEVARESERLATALSQGAGKLRPREMADLAQGLIPIYQRADDRLQQLLDPNEQAAATKTDFDLLTQVDLVSVRQLFDAFGNRQAGEGTGR